MLRPEAPSLIPQPSWPIPLQHKADPPGFQATSAGSHLAETHRFRSGPLAEKVVPSLAVTDIAERLGNVPGQCGVELLLQGGVVGECGQEGLACSLVRGAVEQSLAGVGQRGDPSGGGQHSDQRTWAEVLRL